MPHQRAASIGEYWSIHISAAVSPALGAGLTNRVQTTSTTTIAAGPNQPFTPASIANIFVNEALLVYGGTGTGEFIHVKRVDKANNLVYADFVNSHSGTWNIKSTKGSYLGPLVVNKVGATEVLTLYHGDPAAVGLVTGYPGTPIAVVTPSVSSPYAYGIYLPYGLYYGYTATTPGDYTLHYLDAE